MAVSVGKGGARQLIDGNVDHTRLERLMLRRSARLIQERRVAVNAKQQCGQESRVKEKRSRPHPEEAAQPPSRGTRASSRRR